MSEIKVDKISPQSGTELILGDASDDFLLPNNAELIAQSGSTITIASGATLANAGTATGFGGGKCLAVVQSTKTDTTSTTSATAVTTGLTVTTGTLASTGSKVLVMVSINIGNNTAEQRTHVTLHDADAQLFLGDSGTGHQSTAWMRSMDAYSIYNFAFNYLDSPNATTAQVYTVKFHVTGTQTAWVNRANGEDANSGRTASSIIAMEIGA